MEYAIVTISDRPDLAPIVAGFVLQAFGHADSPSAAEITAQILAPHRGPEETFVLLEGERPVGTAALSYDDLKSRPDLTPWLASVVVEPDSRGKGYAIALVRRVEAMAREAGVQTLWLFTWTAEPLYARLGWQRVGLETNRGREVVLMKRDLTAA
ncbi:GNAT family N-acetyltransferase [Acidisphaera sp. L21]|uniref:GNAT family N-acetyltransferase n=1 Tax=Acidisphaera sp. L21 TaxID=1641851 RepID=UPI00131C6E8E|nr:GNAT family N-acetyltransferase [Acidisphaera sp. L21]